MYINKVAVSKRLLVTFMQLWWVASNYTRSMKLHVFDFSLPATVLTRVITTFAILIHNITWDKGHLLKRLEVFEASLAL